MAKPRVRLDTYKICALKQRSAKLKQNNNIALAGRMSFSIITAQGFAIGLGYIATSWRTIVISMKLFLINMMKLLFKSTKLVIFIGLYYSKSYLSVRCIYFKKKLIETF